MELNPGPYSGIKYKPYGSERDSLFLECLADTCPIKATFAQLNHLIWLEITLLYHNLSNAQCNLEMRNHKTRFIFL
jgi:hypothetical protein